MSKAKEFKQGDKVTYVTPYEKEQGIVKSISYGDYAFVVYNCNGQWENYKDYTAQRTRIIDLVRGWIDE